MEDWKRGEVGSPKVGDRQVRAIGKKTEPIWEKDFVNRFYLKGQEALPMKPFVYFLV